MGISDDDGERDYEQPYQPVRGQGPLRVKPLPRHGSGTKTVKDSSNQLQPVTHDHDKSLEPVNDFNSLL
jgi:hypothetical protein